jgi:hypothetical protein
VKDKLNWRKAADEDLPSICSLWMTALPIKKRLYRFMAAKWALRSIEKRELRVGRLVESNDPFEFVPGIKDEDLLPGAPRAAVLEQLRKAQADLNPIIGLLSFSSTPEEPTLWSHYAESHRGIALGFDVTTNGNVLALMKVKYTPKRPTYPRTLLNRPAWEKFIKKTFTTKAPGWNAESEYRVLVPITRAGCRLENGDYFFPIADNTCALAEVILGCRCPLDDSYVDQTLRQHGFEGVRLARAKLSVDAFEAECSPARHEETRRAGKSTLYESKPER